MSDSWRPRKHDHLVEPVFGALGVERRSERRSLLARFTAWLRSLFRRA